MKLKGIIAPAPTPFDDAQELALDRLAENLARWQKSRLTGFAILGSTGEFVYLSHEEKKRVLARAREAVSADRVLLAGTGCESTRETVELTRWAAKTGYDFAMVVTPAYYKKAMTAEILHAHYLEVADRSEIPIVLYNVPVFTMLNMTPDLVVELAAHPNIVGIKDSAGDILQLQDICQRTPADFTTLTGGASVLLAALTVGARGAILAAANVAFDLCVDLQEAFERGELDRARELQKRLVPVNRAVTAEHGIAGLKALLDHMGFYGGPPRAPLRRPDPESVEILIRIHADSCEQELRQS